MLLRVCPDEEDTIDQIVNLLVDTCSSKRRMLRVAGDDKPAEVVRSRFMKLNADHIRFALKCLAESTAPVRNMKQYLLAALYPPRESNRDKLCSVIDGILLNKKPADFEIFLQKLEQQGYEIKRGKHTSVKGARQKRFIRFRTLGAGYSEDEIKAVIAGEAERRPHQKQPPKEQSFQLLVDIQGKMAEGKSVGYKKWATKFNLKEMSKTLLFLQEQKNGSAEELRERAAAATERYHAIGDSIKAAKAAFDEAGLQKLPKVKELDAEFSELLTKKKAAYPDYRKARNEMQELVRAQKNVERFFAEEKDTTEKTQIR